MKALTAGDPNVHMKAVEFDHSEGEYKLEGCFFLVGFGWFQLFFVTRTFVFFFFSSPNMNFETFYFYCILFGVLEWCSVRTTADKQANEENDGANEPKQIEEPKRTEHKTHQTNPKQKKRIHPQRSA